MGDQFLAFDTENRPLGSESTLQAAQQLVSTATRPTMPPRRDALTLMVSVVAALTVGGAALLIAVRALT
ncbi:hypothetical protein [Curtobacterium sp. MCSS17_005]|uniref:hypothetical protein n=1 Tax=Curtobacterium sp. MCSS17_005 TaxID=2175641 RepID=UPI0011B3A972|nr:hypothetical protein [Curtobacterium sp. MCSS17_005]WIB34360.1 hypothetical protein DEJ20_07805 [Curtobacterium sp. MCSS17_005]